MPLECGLLTVYGNMEVRWKTIVKDWFWAWFTNNTKKSLLFWAFMWIKKTNWIMTQSQTDYTAWASCYISRNTSICVWDQFETNKLFKIEEAHWKCCPLVFSNSNEMKSVFRHRLLLFHYTVCFPPVGNIHS